MVQLPFLFAMNRLYCSTETSTRVSSEQAARLPHDLFRVKWYSLAMHLVDPMQQDKTNIKQTHKLIHAPPPPHWLLLRPSLGIIVPIIYTY